MNQFSGCDLQSFAQSSPSPATIDLTEADPIDYTKYTHNSLLALPITNLAFKQFQYKIKIGKVAPSVSTVNREEFPASSHQTVDMHKMARNLLMNAVRDCKRSVIIEEELIDDIAMKLFKASVCPVDNEPITFSIVPFIAINSSKGNVIVTALGKVVGCDRNDIFRTFLISGYTSDETVAKKVIKFVLQSLHFA